MQRKVVQIVAIIMLLSAGVLMGAVMGGMERDREITTSQTLIMRHITHAMNIKVMDKQELACALTAIQLNHPVDKNWFHACNIVR